MITKISPWNFTMTVAGDGPKTHSDDFGAHT